MTATSPEIKAELMSRGIWPDFVRLRADEKMAHGGTSRTQTIAALEKLAPDLLPMVRGRGRPRGAAPSNTAGVGASGENAAEKPASEFKHSLSDVKRVARDVRAGAEAPHFIDGEAGVGGATRGMFANKSCSNMQSLIWAVESLAFTDTRAEDAPSALAWSLYSLMVQSPSTKADIAKVTAA